MSAPQTRRPHPRGSSSRRPGLSVARAEREEGNPCSPPIRSGAGGGIRTHMPSKAGDFKKGGKGRRINVLLIRCPFPFTRITRSGLQSERYGDPDGHLKQRSPPTVTGKPGCGRGDGDLVGRSWLLFSAPQVSIWVSITLGLHVTPRNPRKRERATNQQIVDSPPLLDLLEIPCP